jgi:NDP-sugar pyrophosphorylase family protein
VQAKALVRVGGRPQLLRLVETLDRIGCTTITCALRADLVAPLETILRGCAGPPFARVPCRTPSSLHTLGVGLEALPGGAVFCTMADTVMPDADWSALFGETSAAMARGADAVVAVTPHVGDSGGLYVERNGHGRLTAFRDESPAHATSAAPAPPVLVTGGVYGLGPAAREIALEAVGTGVDRMRGYLRLLLVRGLDVRAVEVTRIIDLDHRSDLEHANAWLGRPGHAISPEA